MPGVGVGVGIGAWRGAAGEPPAPVGPFADAIIDGGGGVVSTPLPRGLSAGDLVLAILASDAALGSGAGILGQGWTVIDAPASSTPGMQVLWKRMGATPDAAVEITQISAAAPPDPRIGVHFRAYSGVDAAPLDVAPVITTGNTGVPAPGAASPVTAGALSVLVGVLDDDFTSLQPPAGYGDGFTHSAGLGAFTAASADQQLTDAATVTPGAFTFPGAASDQWRALHVLLRADGAAPIGYTPENADNGGAAYLTTPSIGGQTDTPELLMFVAATFQNSASAVEQLAAAAVSAGNANGIRRTATGAIQAEWRSFENGFEADLTTTGLVGAEFVAALLSVDTTRASGHQLSVYTADGWENLSQGRSNIGANLEGTPSTGWSLCALPGGGEAADVVIHRAAFWQGVTLAPSVPVAQQLFLTPSGALVDPAVSVTALGAPLFDIFTGWNSNPGPFTTSGAFAVT